MSLQKMRTPQDVKVPLNAWKLSKVLHREVFLEGSIATSGSGLDRLKERIRDNQRYLYSTAVMMKVISSIFALFVYTLTVSSMEAIDPSSIESSIFDISFSNAMVLVFQFMFIFTYGLISLIGFFSSSAFKYLHTLPIPRKKIKLTAYLTYFRLINWQLVTMLIGLPVASGLGIFVFGGTWIEIVLFVLVSAVISFVNVVFLFSLMISVSLYIAKKVYKPTGGSKFRTVLQILVTLMYSIVSLGASLAISLLFPVVQAGFDVNSQTVNIITNLVIYPFGLTHLYSIFLMGLTVGWHLIPTLYIWVAVAGFLLVTGAAYLLFRRSMKILSSLVKEEVYESKQKSPEEVTIKLDLHKPTKAIFKKDVTFIFRNFSSTLQFIFPILMPLVLLIQIFMISGGGYAEFFSVGMFAFAYSGMTISFAIMCVTAPESETGGLLYILPSNMRDIYRVKRRIMFLSLAASALAPSLILIIFSLIGRFPLVFNPLTPAILITVSFFVIYFYGTELSLVLYSRFFGKMRNKYTIQMLNVKHKFWKIALGIIIIYIVNFLPIIVGFYVGALLGGSALYGALVMLGTALLLAGVIRGIAYKNFNSH